MTKDATALRYAYDGGGLYVLLSGATGSPILGRKRRLQQRSDDAWDSSNLSAPEPGSEPDTGVGATGMAMDDEEAQALESAKGASGGSYRRGLLQDGIDSRRRVNNTNNFPW
jgi:hypothetical protein